MSFAVSKGLGLCGFGIQSVDLGVFFPVEFETTETPYQAAPVGEDDSRICQVSSSQLTLVTQGFSFCDWVDYFLGYQYTIRRRNLGILQNLDFLNLV